MDLDFMDETLATESETLPTRQAKRSGAFMHFDVMNCVDEVDMAAEQYADPRCFIRAVISQLEKLV